MDTPIIPVIAFYIGITLATLLDLHEHDGLAFCNPIRNHKKYPKLNWVGVVLITIMWNILWLPYAIGYWIYKLMTMKVKKK